MNSRKQLSLTLIGWLVLGLATASASTSQNLALNTVQPDAGTTGDRIQLRGRGFNKPAKAYFAWTSANGQGVILDIKRKRSKTRLGAVVGLAPASVTGPVVLWQGTRSVRAPFGIGGRFTVRDASVFKPDVGVRGPSFRASASSAQGISGRLVNGAIHLDFAPLIQAALAETPDADVRLTSDEDEEPPEELAQKPPRIEGITAEGAGESCGEPGGGGSGGGYTAKGFGITLRIECEDRNQCRANPARLVGKAIEEIGGPELEATVEGSTVILTPSEPLCDATFNVTMSAGSGPNATGGPSPSQSGTRLASSPERNSAAISR